MMAESAVQLLITCCHQNVCAKISETFLLSFEGHFGIFRCSSKFQKFYVSITWFLAEPLTVFCGTQRFSETLVGKRWSTKYPSHRAQRHTVLLQGQDP